MGRDGSMALLGEPGGRVLLIDDDPAMHGLVGALLEAAGLGFAGARGAVAGALAARDPSVDVVLLDMRMPDGTGLDVLARLRGAEPTRFLPVVFLTSEPCARARTTGLEGGADDWLAKPFRAAELLARLRVQLRAKRLHDRLQASNARLLELEGLRRELADYMVHDLVNGLAPLTMGLSLAELALAAPAPDPARALRVTTACREAARRLEGMLADLLDVSRLEQGAFPIRPGPCDPAALLAACRSWTGLSADAQATRLSFLASRGGRVLADERVIVRVLTNLVGNALKFTRGRAAAVEVSAAPDAAGARWVFSVRDNGTGIPAARLSGVFDKFFTDGGRDGAAPAGRGLGLAFCRLAVEAHGGRIWAESAEGRGSRFAFTLKAA